MQQEKAFQKIFCYIILLYPRDYVFSFVVSKCQHDHRKYLKQKLYNMYKSW